MVTKLSNLYLAPFLALLWAGFQTEQKKKKKKKKLKDWPRQPFVSCLFYVSSTHWEISLEYTPKISLLCEITNVCITSQKYKWVYPGNGTKLVLTLKKKGG